MKSPRHLCCSCSTDRSSRTPSRSPPEATSASGICQLSFPDHKAGGDEGDEGTETCRRSALGCSNPPA